MKRYSKKALVLTMALMMALAFVACASPQQQAPVASEAPPQQEAPTESKVPESEAPESQAPAAQPIVFKIETNDPEDALESQATVEFGKQIERLTNGTVKLDIYFNGAFCGGDQTTMAELVASGAEDAGNMSSAVLANFAPELSIISLPFMFKTFDDLSKCFLPESETRKLLDEAVSKGGYQMAAWLPRTGRELTNSAREVRTPDDIKGLKIRVQDNKLHVDSMNAIGAQALPMSWGEVYVSLQNKTIDGQENPWSVLVVEKFWEIQKYVTNWDWSFDSIVIYFNKDSWNKMSPEQQAAVLEAGELTRQWHKKMQDEDTAKSRKMLTDNGMTISDLTDEEKALFAEKTKGIIESYRQTIPQAVFDAVAKDIVK